MGKLGALMFSLLLTQIVTVFVRFNDTFFLPKGRTPVPAFL